MGSPTPDDDPTRPRPVPPGQGGWPPPAQYPGPPGGQFPPPGPGGPYPGQRPAPTAQFPAVGGYPAGPYAPGGPYPPPGPGYGPPPPGGGGRGHRGLLIAVIVGLVVLAGLAVALVVAFTREGGETVAAEPSGTTIDAPPSSAPSRPTESPGSTASSEPSAAPSSSPAGDRTDELLAAVPADFTDCAPGEPAGDGDVAAVLCGPSTTQPGPQDGTFHLYEDTATLDRVFAEDTATLDPMPAGADCRTAQGVTTWNVGGVEGGEVACMITGTELLLVWTDREFGIEGIITAPGSTQEELAALADWWTANSDYQG